MYDTRNEARQDIFDYIEMIYNPKPRRNFNDDTPAGQYKKLDFQR